MLRLDPIHQIRSGRAMPCLLAAVVRGRHEPPKAGT
jgi:hypothetical protein